MRPIILSLATGLNNVESGVGLGWEASQSMLNQYIALSSPESLVTAKAASQLGLLVVFTTGPQSVFMSV